MPVETPVFDYIRTVNALCEQSLQSHGELLERKNIRRKQDFIQAIKLDLDKLTHALLEVRERAAADILQTFFDSGHLDPAAVSARLIRQCIYHVGFEIHEPLDLVLQGIGHWIEHSRQSLGGKMQVTDYLRFPASAALQKRVGAFTEIMRIWIQVEDCELMLELFDIHRPADAYLACAPKPAHRNFHGLFREGQCQTAHTARVEELFATDEIWHYAFQVRHPEDVTLLHRECCQLAGSNPTYTVPYSLPVDNRHDGSFHTKIIRNAGFGGDRMELEFVSQTGQR